MSNGPNNTTNNGSANNRTNNGSANHGTSNNAMTNPTNNTTGVCRGSAFDSCPADDDALSREILNGDFTQGCPAPDDNFGAGVVTASARAICPLEESDRYDTTVSRCQSAPFFVDVEVVPTDECAQSDWVLDASFDGNDCVEPNGVVQCSDLANGGKRATFIVEPGNSFHSLYTTIEPQVENARFDYDLTITFRQ